MRTSNSVMCPLCGSTKSDVIQTQDKGDFVRRRRVCLICDNRFNTIETIDPAPHRGKKKGKRK